MNDVDRALVAGAIEGWVERHPEPSRPSAWIGPTSMSPVDLLEAVSNRDEGGRVRLAWTVLDHAVVTLGAAVVAGAFDRAGG